MGDWILYRLPFVADFVLTRVLFAAATRPYLDGGGLESTMKFLHFSREISMFNRSLMILEN